MATSMGMQGVLNTGNYAYVPKGGRLTQKRMQSAGSGARREFKQRSNSRFGGNINDAVSYMSAVSAATDVTGSQR